jgi:hypothetical protein
MPDKIQKQVDFFKTLEKSYGVVFTDATYITAEGLTLRTHYDHLFRKGLIKKIPQGDVYTDVVSTYFIASPTMMIRKEVLDELGGYDENLSYEDFDFWVRSARKFLYAYIDSVTMKIRFTERSMSTGWYRQGDRQLLSTYEVCKKAAALNRSEADREALAKRLKFEIRQSVFSQNHNEAKLFYQLLKEIGYNDFLSASFIALNKLKLPLSFIRNMYHRLRYS